jgi:transposase
MLGLDGFVLLAVSQCTGELEQAVETTATEDFCRGCGVQARLHDRRPSWVRDLPAGGRPVTLVWVKRVWRCMESGCPVATWTEASASIRPRASLTERARVEACRRVGQDGHSVAQVAASLGVGWGTVMAAVRDHGGPRVDDPARLAGVAALGVDETAFLAATAAHHTVFVTGLVDVARPRLLDVVPGRSGSVLAQWIHAQPVPWRDQITVAALDPFRGYATALRVAPGVPRLCKQTLGLPTRHGGGDGQGHPCSVGLVADLMRQSWARFPARSRPQLTEIIKKANVA